MPLISKAPARNGLHNFGTCSHTDSSAHSGDTSGEKLGRRRGCRITRCSGLKQRNIQCQRGATGTAAGAARSPAGADLKEGLGEYKYPAGTKRPEYETAAAFGAMCLNTNAEAIAMANHICNYYGVDTISAGTIIAFAMECYEHGIITKKDTDGIDA